MSEKLHTDEVLDDLIAWHKDSLRTLRAERKLRRSRKKGTLLNP